MFDRLDARQLSWDSEVAGGGMFVSGELQDYLADFARAAEARGLPANAPGANWVSFAPIVRGSHISLSVARHQIQVNLNNEHDVDRKQFDQLYASRHEIEVEAGEGLIWEKKDGRKKTAIRVTLESGYEDGDWASQHAWALDMVGRFHRIFGRRLA